MLLSQAIEIYVTHMEAEHKSEATMRGYRGALMLFCLFVQDPLIQLVTVDQIDLYFKLKKQIGWKQNSMVVPSMALRKFFEYWKRRGNPVLDYNMIPVVPKYGVEPRVASSDALEKILEKCAGNDIYDVRNRVVIMLLADTGMRNGELCSMDVDVLKKFEMVETNGVKQYAAIIRSEKRRGSRESHRRVFWYEETHVALMRWARAREKYAKLFPLHHPEALFVSTKNSHGKVGSRMTHYTVGIVLRDLSVQAGIPTVNAHSLRHKFGSDMAEMGLNNSNISDLMGHASLASSFVYTHLNGKQLAAAHLKAKRPDNQKPS